MTGRILGLLCLGLLSSCASFVDRVTEDSTASFDQGIYYEWYLGYGYECLPEIIADVLEGHPRVKSAKERVEQARLQKRFQRSGMGPSLQSTVTGSSEKERVKRQSSDGVEAVGIGLTADWELDMRGSLRAAYRAGVAYEQIAWAEYESVRASLAAEVLFECLQLSSSIEQESIYKGLINNASEQLKLVDRMFTQGQASRLDLMEQKSNLVSLRTRSLEATESRERATRRLVSFCGEGRVEDLVMILSNPARVSPVSFENLNTSNLLDQRLDLLALRREFEVRNADLARALAERWPKISLGWDFESSASSLSRLFETQLTTLFAELVWDVFNSGEKKLRIEIERLKVREIVSRLEEASIDAIEEVSLAMIRYKYTKDKYDSILNDLSLAKDRVAEAERLYLNGVEGYERLLAALIYQQELSISLAGMKRDLGLDRLELMMSLGWRAD
ncbi:TolC family protein [Puniceicoccaceae bacterium K14]|nr:TolC family protein [Puniceicoccaceae bacterium K14]